MTAEEGKVIERLTPLARLSLEPEKVLGKHKIVEHLMSPSPYLPSLGIECELIVNRYPDDLGMPWEQIKIAVDAGMKRGDDRDKDIYKEELDLRPVQGTHIVHAQELALLKNTKILHLKKRSKHEKEFYPIHINLGVPADTTYLYRNPYLNHDDYIPKYQWKNARQLQEAPIREEVLELSESFLFARMFEATGWATSANRIVMPFKTLKKTRKYSGHYAKGFSGITHRPPNETELSEPVTEIRTAEIWGDENLRDFQRYLKTIQHVGGALKSYMKLPINLRDEILLAELSGDNDKPLEVIMGYKDFSQPHDADLAYLWHELRHKAVRIFAEHNLTNPMHEYIKSDFKKFAKQLPSVNKSASEIPLNTKMRSLLTQYRGKVAKVIE
jgi:hypothetical protein